VRFVGAAIGGLVLAAIAAVAWLAHGRSDGLAPGAAPPVEVTRDDAALEQAEAARAAAPSVSSVAPVASGPEARLDAAPRVVAPATPPPSRPADPKPVDPEAARRIAENQRARKQVDAWLDDARQPRDPARRETALVALESAIRSSDTVLALAAVDSLPRLRHCTDLLRFQDALYARLQDGSRISFLHVTRALRDVGRGSTVEENLLAIVEAHPDDTALLVQAMKDGEYLARKRRVEGRLAAHFVRVLARIRGPELLSVAYTLRDLWVVAEVEAAVIDAWKRSPDPDDGRWGETLAEMEPTREPRIRLILDLSPEAHPELRRRLEGALRTRQVDAESRGGAARLAAAHLASGGADEIQGRCVELLAEFGAIEHVPVLRAFAADLPANSNLRRDTEVAIQRIEGRR
jgi:hypothetical protein